MIQWLAPGLVEGLEEYVPRLTLEKVEGASHWIIHERPQFVAQQLGKFLRQ
jgi:pimeloyl-ACP methyl ester carboxylesterase